MRYLFLKRRLIKLLDELYYRNRATPTREEFVDYIVKNKKPSFKYVGDDDIKFSNKINTALGDCILGRGQYIGYEDATDKMKKINGEKQEEINQSKYLRVTEQGREFYNTFRIELFYKHAARTTKAIVTILVAIIASSGFWILVAKIYNIFAVKNNWPTI